MEAFEEFAEKADEELGDSLKQLYLYGSVARGDHTEESDVDVFAVVEKRQDLETLRDLSFDVGVLKHSVSISVQGEVSEDLDFSQTSYLRNIRREGVRYA
jgi:predicted nucleotidyltransferase